MTERLIAKLDRLGAEAGIKEMTPEIYRFAQLLNDDKLKQWDEWRAKREWVGMPDDEKEKFVIAYYPSNWDRKTAVALMNNYEAYLKEKNT